MTADDPALPDREALLALAVREITAAWASFDRPRPKEAVLDEALAQRLLDPLPEAPGDPAEAMHDAARVLDASISPARPLYLAYIGSTGLATGAMASALASTYDVNLAADAAAGEFLDGQALRWTADFVGYPHADGAFTSGGQVSNLTALGGGARAGPARRARARARGTAWRRLLLPRGAPVGHPRGGDHWARHRVRARAGDRRRPPRAP